MMNGLFIVLFVCHCRERRLNGENCSDSGRNNRLEICSGYVEAAVNFLK